MNQDKSFIMSQADFRMRQLDCVYKGLCFVSLKPLAEDAKGVQHHDGHLSVPLIFVNKEYIK
jgi:hypothetical protein